MSQPDPSERLARKLPPDGVRRILARLEQMVSHGETGDVAVIKLDGRGQAQVLVPELFAWRDGGAR